MTVTRLVAHTAALAAVVLAGACAPVAAPEPPRDPLRVPGRPAPDAMPWSAERRLAWTDFQGQPDMSSTVAAVTTYALAWESGCSSDGFTFDVASVFLPDQSWVKPDVPGRGEESRRTLAHEQAHFDLSEIHARKMRRELARLVQPCRLTEAELSAAIEPIIREDQSLQERFDLETRNGLDLVQQDRWEQDIARQLVALNRYAAPRGLTPERAR